MASPSLLAPSKYYSISTENEQTASTTYWYHQTRSRDTTSIAISPRLPATTPYSNICRLASNLRTLSISVKHQRRGDHALDYFVVRWLWLSPSGRGRYEAQPTTGGRSISATKRCDHIRQSVIRQSSVRLRELATNQPIRILSLLLYATPSLTAKLWASSLAGIMH